MNKFFFLSLSNIVDDDLWGNKVIMKKKGYGILKIC